MDGYEATRIVFSRIQSLDPENASKIMGLLLIQDHGEKEMIRLAFGPETLVHSLVLKARKELGLSSPSSTPSSPFTNSTLSRQNSTSSSRLGFNIPPSLTIPNPSSNSSSSWSDHDHLISPSNSTLNPASLPFYANGSGESELIEEFRLQDQLSFLGDNSNPNPGPRSPDLYYPPHQQLDSLSSPTGSGSDMYWGGSGHKRSCSFSDVSGSEDPSSVYEWRPCLYYARGYCKNGSNCRFVHSGIAEVDGSSMVSSPNSSGKIELMEQCHDMLRSATNKSAQQQQRLAAAAQLMASSGSGSGSGSGSFPYSPKCINFLLQQQQSDSQRAAAAAAFMMGEEIQKFGRFRLDRNDLVNPASRQIYLTFPADSTFREEDVSSYFSIYGPVQDVRIPYQQKRMFGFVTFVYPETVKIILAKGNPHFVCDARVLVKPYKEKGKVPDKYRKQAQQVERGDFSPCGTPTGLDSRDPFDLSLGSRMFYNTQDILWKRKLEEQADLQQAIEIQSRRLMGFQLLDVKKQHHHRALPTGSPIPSPTHSPSFFSQTVSFPPLHTTTDSVQDNCSSPVPAVSATTPPEKQAAISSKDSNGSEENASGKAISHGEGSDLLESLEHNLPDSPFASPTKESGEYFSSFNNAAPSEADKDATIPPTSSCNNNLVTSTLIPANSRDMTSFKSFNCQVPRFSSGHGAIGMYAGTGGPTCPVGI